MLLLRPVFQCCEGAAAGVREPCEAHRQCVFVVSRGVLILDWKLGLLPRQCEWLPLRSTCSDIRDWHRGDCDDGLVPRTLGYRAEYSLDAPRVAGSRVCVLGGVSLRFCHLPACRVAPDPSSERSQAEVDAEARWTSSWEKRSVPCRVAHTQGCEAPFN